MNHTKNILQTTFIYIECKSILPQPQVHKAICICTGSLTFHVKCLKCADIFDLKTVLSTVHEFSFMNNKQDQQNTLNIISEPYNQTVVS
jgi:hypothetical protein